MSDYCDPTWLRPETLARIDQARVDWTDDDLPVCHDCGKPIRAFAKSAPVGGGRIYGDPCWHRRTTQGWEWDPRSLIELQQQDERKRA